jgi:hypothetical protein
MGIEPTGKCDGPNGSPRCCEFGTGDAGPQCFDRRIRANLTPHALRPPLHPRRTHGASGGRRARPGLDTRRGATLESRRFMFCPADFAPATLGAVRRSCDAPQRPAYFFAIAACLATSCCVWRSLPRASRQPGRALRQRPATSRRRRRRRRRCARRRTRRPADIGANIRRPVQAVRLPRVTAGGRATASSTTPSARCKSRRLCPRWCPAARCRCRRSRRRSCCTRRAGKRRCSRCRRPDR